MKAALRLRAVVYSTATWKFGCIQIEVQLNPMSIVRIVTAEEVNCTPRLNDAADATGVTEWPLLL